MNASIHDTLNLAGTIFACIGILGIIVLVNYAFSRDNMITHQNNKLKHQQQ